MIAASHIVLATRKESPTTSTLVLRREDGLSPAFRAGQYIAVYFPDLSQTLGKQYSISSAPCEEEYAISVKAIGRFSQRLSSLQPGEKLLASAPQGNFSPHSDDPLVMIAGGIGVMPFRSIIFEMLAREPRRRMTLLYSAKRSIDMPYADELRALSAHTPAFTFHPFITQESRLATNARFRRPTIDDIRKAAEGRTPEYMLCGSLSFVLAIKQLLLAQGIDRNDIRTEAHF